MRMYMKQYRPPSVYEFIQQMCEEYGSVHPGWCGFLEEYRVLLLSLGENPNKDTELYKNLEISFGGSYKCWESIQVNYENSTH